VFDGRVGGSPVGFKVDGARGAAEVRLRDVRVRALPSDGADERVEESG
jgi:hypothetical protein